MCESALYMYALLKYSKMIWLQSISDLAIHISQVPISGNNNENKDDISSHGRLNLP